MKWWYRRRHALRPAAVAAAVQCPQTPQTGSPARKRRTLLPTSITFSGGGTGTVELESDGRVTVDPGDGLGTGSFTYLNRIFRGSS